MYNWINGSKFPIAIPKYTLSSAYLARIFGNLQTYYANIFVSVMSVLTCQRCAS